MIEFYFSFNKFDAILDSGSIFCLMRYKLARRLDLMINYDDTTTLQCANSQLVHTIGSSLFYCSIGS